MAALSHQTMINGRDSYYLSSIGNDVLHSTIKCQELDASLARFSTVYVSDFLTTSTLNASTFKLNYLDLSEANISTVRTNNIFTSSQTWASDLSGGVGYVRISTDASGVQVDGDPIRFDNLVYFTSTITIVPVSTIVDTDIFSQNGYFSTLSSGSISSGALQTSSLLAHNAFMSTLTVSSIITTDISGFSPTTWSLYPTLNSSVIFSGGNTLSNVGTKLFFAGNEITDLSGGGQNWSQFPATQDVSMNNFSLRGISTLQFQDAARLTSLTGNNLQYNGQPISYGPSGNASNWSLYPAKTDITAGQSTLTVGNIQNNGSNITNGNTFTNSLGVGGLSLVPIASISAGGDLSCRNIEVGDAVTGLADVNIYGATAAPGDNALYVEGGVTFSGGTIHGFTAGVLPVAGINTGRIDMLQAGFNILHPLVGAITTGTAMSLTAGAAISMAAGGYLEINTSTIQCINTTQGNKNTTLQTGFITVDPDIAATSSIKLFNVLGGGVEIDGGGQGSLQGFSTIQASNFSSYNLNVSTINGHSFSSIVIPQNIDCSNINVTNTATAASTNTTTLRANFSQLSTVFWNFALGVSTTLGALQVNNIQIADNITGVTNAPNPNQSRLLNFSTVNSFNVSTTDFWCSSINGQTPGGGGGGGTINNFSTLTASSFQVSSISAVGGFPIKVIGPLSFQGQNAIDNVDVINLNGEFPNTLQINASTIIIGGNNVLMTSISTTRQQVQTGLISTLATVNNTTSSLSVSSINQIGGTAIKIGGTLEFITPNSIDKVVNINTDDTIPDLTINAQRIFLSASDNTYVDSLSTQKLSGNIGKFSTLQGPVGLGLDISGALNMVAGNINVPLGNAVSFDDGSFVNFSQFEYRDVASAAMLALTNNPGLASNNMAALGVGEIFLTGGADQYQAVRIYSQFPYGNFEFDAIDANGATLFAYMQGYQNPLGTNPGFLQAYSNVSSISGYDESSAANQMLNVINGLTTSNLIVSSINGQPVDNSTFDNQFSTLFVSSLNFSTAVSVGSNTDFNYPIFIDYDQAGNTSNAGVAIAVQGHNYAGGAVVNRIEMGARATGENYIMSVWPGQNLEELFIDATDLTVRDGIFSTIINLDPFGLKTTGGIMGPFMSTLDLNVSSINSVDANKAFTNNLQLSTMLLYTASTTLAYWDSTTVSSNVNTSGYDTVVGVNGTYKVGCSIQATNVGGTDDMSFFFLKNDIAIPNSATYTLVKNNELISTYAEIIEPCNNGDKLQVGYYTTGANVYVSTIGGVTPAGDAPAAIFTCYKID